jgi:hypothetical protein
MSAQRLRVVTQEKQQLSAQLQNTRAALAAAENACRAWEAYTKQLQNDWCKEKACWMIQQKIVLNLCFLIECIFFLIRHRWPMK